MIKMIVSSFHNTLIDNEGAIPMSTMLEIERIRKKKILFTICTNRGYKEVLEYNKDFPFIDYIISLNGSYVYDVLNNKVIFKKKINQTTINKIEKIISDKNKKYYSLDEIYDDYNQIKEKDIYKIEIEIKNDDEGNKIKELISKAAINVNYFQYEEKKYIEITSNQASMFNGVDKIGLKNNITLNDVLVICGNESDISLVQNINKSYIVKNSPSELKKICKKQTAPNTSKGVEIILKKVV